jgi:hypothetical protein
VLAALNGCELATPLYAKLHFGADWFRFATSSLRHLKFFVTNKVPRQPGLLSPEIKSQ